MIMPKQIMTKSIMRIMLEYIVHNDSYDKRRYAKLFHA
jgi:hypothetical protein